jgi:hypothetical protein
VFFAPTRTLPAQLLTRHLETAETLRAALPQITREVTGCWEHEGYVYLESCDNLLRVLEPLTGEILCEHPVPPRRQNGRFYRTPDNHWWAVMYNGQRSRLVRVPMTPRAGLPKQIPSHSLVGYIDSSEGPVGIGCHAGTLYLLTDDVKQLHVGYTLQPPLRIKAVSRDNQRVWIGSDHSQGWIIHLGATPSWQYARRDWWDQLEPAVGAQVRDASLRSHLAGIVVRGDYFGFVTRRGQQLLFKLDPSGKAILLRSHVEPIRTDDVSSFAPLNFHTGVKFTLQVAVGPSGSRAYCDSRGLLHLCPVDPKEPELCLVLPADGSVAGWSSTGEFHGPAFYLGDHPSVDASRFFERLTRFARQWV